MNNQIEIDAILSEKIGFATHQNQVAVIRDIVIRNTGETDLTDLKLIFECSPELIKGKEWPIDRINAGSEIRINDRKTYLDGGRLEQLTEKMLANFSLSVQQGGETIAEKNGEITGLAKNEWGGSSYEPELLAAFITPNDTAVQQILSKAGDILQANNSSLSGYQSRSRKQSWAITAAIWSAVAALRLNYSEPPASFESAGQKIRFPADIVEHRLATCLDSTLLFAAALEGAGLYPLIIFTKGHAFCGVWLQPQHLHSFTTDDCMEIRKHGALNELIVFETTCITQAPPPSFSQAIAEGERKISEQNEDDFLYALDVNRARQSVRPLGEQKPPPTPATPAPQADEPLQLDIPPDDLTGFDLGIEIESGEATPETRLNRWQRKLLDLTKRNRLINLKDSKTTIRLLCSADKLEDKLAEGKAITVVPKAETGSRDEELMREQQGKDFATNQAEILLEENNQAMAAKGEEKDIDAGLTQLYRKARMDLQEGGSNTLYLALGVLKWKQNPDDKRSYRAPLILMPVKLERKNARTKIKITKHEDETVLNMTLLEMLRQDFNVDLGYLEAELPEDEAGVDVHKIWDIVRREIRDTPGFEVTEEVILSTFSFAKYLMWKDLIAIEQLPQKTPLVSRLISGGTDSEYSNSPSFIPAQELDKKINPGELYMPLLADSSQVVAVDASAKKGDFILEGPPGTGKSQTIANIIAHNLIKKRRILFVSEKMAALEVVYKRLREHGLGNFCLELHSSKANKKGVLDQLRQSWHSDRPDRYADLWERERQRLENLRDRTNNLVKALHTNGATGISPYSAMGRKVRYQHEHPLTLDWDDLENDRAKDRQGLEELTQMAGELGTAYIALDDNASTVFSSVKKQEWTHAWENQFIEAAKQLAKTIDRVLETSSQLATYLQLPEQAEISRNYLEGLKQIASTIPSAHSHSIKFCLDGEGEDILENLASAYEHLQSYRAQQAKLSSNYNDERIMSAPLNEFQDAWNKAIATPIVINFIRRILVKQNIKKFFAIKTINEPGADLSILLEMRATRKDMDAVVTTFPPSTGWRGLETDEKNITVRIKTAQNLLQGIRTLAQGNVTALNDIRNNIKPLYAEKALLAPEEPLSNAANAYIAAWEAFNKAEQDYQEQIDSSGPLPDNIRTIKEQIEKIMPLKSNIRSWCIWQKHVNEAKSNGLNALVTALENGTVGATDIKEAFKTAYHTWLSWHMIDNTKELREFNSHRHEEFIQNFRAADKEVDALVTRQIQATLHSDIPQKDATTLDAGYRVLKHEMQKQKRHIPIRKLIEKMGNALTDLCPCLMMSPLSVAQFLPADKTKFDLVVFDEASQITVWDAIGAIARGDNVIIVGDPKQMPPTSFFDRAASDDEDDENEELTDQESILDEAVTASIKTHRLTGHYRSKHESLIAFSNHQYYDGELVTYPSSQTKKSMISFRKIEGEYQRGKGRVNVEEAKAVVAEVVRRITESPDTSVGVVTLNSEQQRLINNLLDDERRKNPQIEQFFNDENNTSPVFVKNLETVQGDERDIILISVGYGPDTPGAQTMSMNFGPLNRLGGERRLNVAITRATTEVVIFASFNPSMIDLTKTSARAVHDLRHYLEFAERGPVALGEAIKSVGNYYDSDFERTVADQLSNLGWTVHPQVGISRFRIDLGITHPNKPGKYLAGIECDGATYHRSPSARDRDRIRQSILESLGWKLVRIWSTDYFLNEKEAIAGVDEKLNQLLNEDTEDSPETATTPTE